MACHVCFYVPVGLGHLHYDSLLFSFVFGRWFSFLSSFIYYFYLLCNWGLCIDFSIGFGLDGIECRLIEFVSVGLAIKIDRYPLMHRAMVLKHQNNTLELSLLLCYCPHVFHA